MDAKELEHLHRHPDTIGYKFLNVQDELWLRTIRCLIGSFGNTRSSEAGATGTRAGPGFPLRFLGSWYESLRNSECFLNPNRSKHASKEHASLLHDKVFI